MYRTGVAYIKFRRLDKTLPGVDMLRFQPSHQQQSHQQVNISVDGRDRDLQAGRKPEGIQQLTLVVGEHGPQSPQGFSRYARTKLRHIALKTGADEILS